MTTTRLSATLAAIDQVNTQDPNQEQANGKSWPKELLYSQRMSDSLAAHFPEAPELLTIAARAQHIGRWQIPRSDYPKTKPGYKQWRTELGKMHAEKTAELMAAEGYSEEDQARVKQLLTKRQLKSDELVQTLEDVICLVFLQYYLDDFANQHEHSKLIDIIQKTWHKMSAAGHAHALKLPLSEASLALVQEALA
ncbi:DUF4202 domain-containing protein [Halioxenophilus sp. WMMB6]|uniref:DUF4202 domain-containing protein n=1 Tax=Halioxenophilus sp. WMMB6 TaxID=3073815 RepID=UPI00295ED898|nr:DUF4202 domain-containing protein [Halioxenophilus sp. WMMB6]